MTCDVVATGSTGNFSVLNGMIALDMGVPYKTVEPYKKDLRLVCIGHQHGDHLNKSTVGRLALERPALRFAVGEFLVNHLLQAGVPVRNIDVMEPNKEYDYGKFKISPVSLVHDVPNYGFRIFIGNEKAIYMVDTGTVAHIEAKGYDLYLLERNHEETEIADRLARKIAAGEYAYEARAAATHLSEEQAIAWLAENAGPNSRYQFLHQHSQKKGRI